MSGTLGNRTTLKKGTSAIAELTKISPPEITQEAVDATTLDSEDNYDEFIGGRLNGGEVGVEGNFKKGATVGQETLLTDLNAQTVNAYTITFPTGSTWEFNALVTKFKIGDVQKNGIIPFSATLKVSGKPDFTSGT